MNFIRRSVHDHWIQLAYFVRICITYLLCIINFSSQFFFPHMLYLSIVEIIALTTLDLYLF